MRPGKRRDYAKAAENAALLGAQLAGYSLPIGPALGLARAMGSKTSGGDAEAFVVRFVNEIAAWCEAHKQPIDDVGGMPSNWDDYLIDKLAERPPADQASAQELLMQTLFLPLTETSRSACERIASELAHDMPELVVRAGDPYGAFGALRALSHGDTNRIEFLLERLSPDVKREADPALVFGYLKNLIQNLNVDYWSVREGAAPATLSAVHQRLRLTSASRAAQHAAVEVDDLLSRCVRLVVLGGPGSGKSWTARRAAIRAAEAALNRIDDGTPLDEVELPLYAACSQVLEKGEMPRSERLVNATLGWALTDASQAARLSELLLYHHRVLIVLDGLDEAARPENNALYEFAGSTGTGTRRLVLTSRPGSWDESRLHIDEDDDRHEVGYLEPFDDDDIQAAVSAWLKDAPTTRDRLLESLETTNPTLSRQASVPLLCAMLCLVARPDPQALGDPFDVFEPGRLLDLYDTAIRKLLAAPWRDRSTKPSNSQVRAAFGWLEELAEAGDETDLVTGLGKWPDAIETPDDPPSGCAEHVDHVAPPNADPTGGYETRRFIHRSIREHLTARALRRREPVDLAADLLRHLWFDPDWTDVIPAVIAGHPQADLLVTELARVVDAITTADPTQSLESALRATAGLTRPDSHSPLRTEAINRALLAALDRTPSADWVALLSTAHHWPAGGTARDRLLDLLVTIPDLAPSDKAEIAQRLAGLGPTPDQARRAADLLAGTLTDTPHLKPRDAAVLADVLRELHPESDQMSRVSDLLFQLLADTPNIEPWSAAGLADSLVDLGLGPDRTRSVIERLIEILVNTPNIELWDAMGLARSVAALGPTPNQVERVVNELLGNRIPRSSAAWEVTSRLGELLVELGHTPNYSKVLLLTSLTSELDLWQAGGLIRCLTELGPTPDEIQSAGDRLVELLVGTPDLETSGAATVASALAELGPTPDQVQSAGDRLVELLATAVRLDEAVLLAETLAGLRPTLEQRQSAGDELIRRIDDSKPEKVPELASAMVGLQAQPNQSEDLADRLLDLLATPRLGQRMTARLAEALVDMELTDGQSRQVRDRLVEHIHLAPTSKRGAARLAGVLARLGPTPDQARRVNDRLLEHLGSSPIDQRKAARLALALVALTPTPDEARRASSLLLNLIVTIRPASYDEYLLTEPLAALRQLLPFEEWATVLSEQRPLK